MLENPGTNLTEYGALGALVAGLIWLIRMMLVRMMMAIDNNTRVMAELCQNLKGKTMCPFSDLGDASLAEVVERAQRTKKSE